MGPVPEKLDLDTPDIFSWFGRASAVLTRWDPYKAVDFNVSSPGLNSPFPDIKLNANRKMQTVLHQAIHDLRLKTGGPLTVALDQGAVYDYFDEVRKLIETAKSELLFVDPYLDAEFVPPSAACCAER